MKIFLIGLPGCGKTTLGKQVAQLLDKNFVDLDAEIVKGEQQSIAQLFVKEGEAPFRIVEQKYLKLWCGLQEDFVMATGGGTPCFLANIELINKAGISVFLDATAEEISTRMLNTELAKRPLFAGQDKSTIEGRVQEMRMQRISFYEQANITLSGDQISAENIAKSVLELKI